MDAEATVARALKEGTGYPCYLEKPSAETLGGATEYMVVTQTYGGDSVLDQLNMDVDCYAPKGQRKKARAVADAVAAAVPSLEEDGALFVPEVSNVYRQNDPQTGEARYVVQLSVYRNN